MLLLSQTVIAIRNCNYYKNVFYKRVSYKKCFLITANKICAVDMGNNYVDNLGVSILYISV